MITAKDFDTMIQADPFLAIIQHGKEFSDDQFETFSLNYPVFALARGERLSPEKLEATLKNYPEAAEAALEMCSKCLTQEQFEWCSEKSPRLALRCGANRLNPYFFDRCCRAEPWTALELFADKLEPELFEECCRLYPMAALQFTADKLSEEQITYFLDVIPWAVLLYCSHRIDRKLLVELANSHEWVIDPLLEENPNDPLTHSLIKVIDDLDPYIAECVRDAIANGI